MIGSGSGIRWDYQRCYSFIGQFGGIGQRPKRITTFRLQTNPHCALCPGIVEDNDHIFRFCVRAMDFWESKGLSCDMSSPFNTWFKTSLFAASTGSDNIPFNVHFAFGCWAIWKRRNVWCVSQINIPLSSSIKPSSWAALEWFYTQKQPSKEPKPNPPKWSGLPHGTIKINIDASSSPLLLLRHCCSCWEPLW